jgi:hypothetical protein
MITPIESRSQRPDESATTSETANSETILRNPRNAAKYSLSLNPDQRATEAIQLNSDHPDPSEIGASVPAGSKRRNMDVMLRDTLVVSVFYRQTSPGLVLGPRMT